MSAQNFNFAPNFFFTKNKVYAQRLHFWTIIFWQENFPTAKNLGKESNCPYPLLRRQCTEQRQRQQQQQ